MQPFHDSVEEEGAETGVEQVHLAPGPGDPASAARHLLSAVPADRAVLWIMVGVIGSGKTTLCREVWKQSQRPLLRICLDDIVQMLSFYSYEQEMKLLYADMERLPMVKGLTSGCSVIIDRTSLTREIRERFLSVGRKVRAMAADLRDKAETDRSRNLVYEEQLEKYLERRFPLYQGREDALYIEAFRELMDRRAASGGAGSLFPEESEPGITADLVQHMEEVAGLSMVAVYYDVDIDKCLKRRKEDPAAASRNVVRKVDWDRVMEEMTAVLEPPRKEEGFDAVFKIGEGWSVSVSS